jgi:multiple sugar transport system substrate-binding protein
MAPIARSRLWLGCLLVAVCAGGCWTQSKGPSDPGQTRKDVRLTLLVVEDPALATAVDRLRAEWQARSGATLSIQQITAAELVAAEVQPAGVDAIIYPSGQIGLLAQQGWIVALPADYAAISELAWSDTFELAQVAETRWGQTPFAAPFGSAMLTCYYRADLFDRFHKHPPQTWTEYHELAELFARGENLEGAALPEGWHGTVEPLAPGWAGRVLLARAAAYARHRDHYSTLFNIDTMEPLIAGAPFVRALEELVAAARLGPPDAIELDPAAARREFLAGRAALALAFPGHSTAGDAKDADNKVPTGFAELPGSPRVYNFAGKAWENRKSDENPHVPLLCFAGRLGSVAAQSPHGESAFQLLAWLSGREWGTSVSSASAATTLYRRSQLRVPQPWLDPLTDSQAARQYALSVRDALSRQAYLSAVRIPGQEKYLDALDAAVAQAVRDARPAAEALGEAANVWRKITADLGLETQRDAYRKSEGLEP